MNRLVVISGCSGGGKSTLLAELAKRGYAVVDEPGRRIIAEERSNQGAALPWIDLEAFLRRAIKMALDDQASMGAPSEWVFFDRGLIDAASGLHYLTGEPILATLTRAHRYHHRVFLTPPWPEIYRRDPQRRHGFGEALAEYSRLLEAFPAQGYEVFVLPKVAVETRADFVLDTLAKWGKGSSR